MRRLPIDFEALIYDIARAGALQEAVDSLEKIRSWVETGTRKKDLLRWIDVEIARTKERIPDIGIRVEDAGLYYIVRGPKGDQASLRWIADSALKKLRALREEHENGAKEGTLTGSEES